MTNNTLAMSTSVDLDTPQDLKPNTIRTYRLIYDRYMRNALESREINPDEPALVIPMDLVDDWFANSAGNQPRTANIHRSALLWVLRNSKAEGWEDAHARLTSMKQRSLYSVSGQDNQETPKKRSRAPGRMLPQQDFETLSHALANKGTWGARAQWFLIAGVASGARPIEWPEAEWVDEENGVLRIFTAKVKSRNAWHHIPPLTFTEEDLDNEVDQMWDARSARGKEGALTRYEIDFERRIATLDLTDEELELLRAARYKNGVRLFRDVFIEPRHRLQVRLHMDSVAMDLQKTKDESQGDAPTELVLSDYYYNTVRHCIWRTCKQIFPDGRLYSPADTRSTFAANRKALNGLVAASVEMGHAGVTSSRDFYAPASKAWLGYKPKPVKSQADMNEATVLTPNGAKVMQEAGLAVAPTTGNGSIT